MDAVARDVAVVPTDDCDAAASRSGGTSTTGRYEAIARTGYQNFGSFFTDNVEDMIAVAPHLYVPPPLPFTRPALDQLCAETPLGAACRHLFSIDFDGWTFVNHGAFGAVCRAAQEEGNAWRERCEQQPLRFLDRELFPQMVRVMREASAFIGASQQDLVFVPNATTGLNVAIRAAGLAPGDVIYMLNIGYGSVKKMAQAAAAATAAAAAAVAAAAAAVAGVALPGDPDDKEVARGPPPPPPPPQEAGVGVESWGSFLEALSGVEVVYGEVTFPISGPQDIVDLVARSMPPRTKLAVFDSVTSNTALVLPVEQLVALCRERGVQVLVDGAHALGQLPVDLSSLDPDFFVTNCHKWLCAPRGSALLWVSPRRRSAVVPLVVSHGSGAGFTSDFIWDGCRDYAAYLATSSALEVWQRLGPERIRSYMRVVLGGAVDLLTQRWGTALLAPSLDMCGAMALIGLPLGLAAARRDGAATSDDAKYIQDLLHHVHCVECPVKCIQGRLYARISVHIYNTLDDYKALADAVGHIAEHLRSSETRGGAGGEQEVVALMRVT